MSRDDLGDRMKDHERRSEVRLPRRTHTIIRLDGKAFHTYTRDLESPFDPGFVFDMAETARYLAENVSGCALVYTQSDEISLVLTDFAQPTTQAWFDNKLQKLVSVSASMATARFNQLRPDGGLALFDSRAFTLADPSEVANYFLWRQQDAARNSVSMAAQSVFSHRELQGVPVRGMLGMLRSEHGIEWEDYDPRFRRGQVVFPQLLSGPVSYVDKRTGKTVHLDLVDRRSWRVNAAPIFSENRDWLLRSIAGEMPEFPAG